MSLVAVEQRLAAEQRIVTFYPDPTYVSFVAKTQKSTTRKDKDYFVLRVTIPKQIAKKIDARPEDYLVLRAKKAAWYHMVNWREMGATWGMLPPEIKVEVTLTGLPNPDLPELMAPSSQQMNWPQLGVATGTATSVKPAITLTQP